MFIKIRSNKVNIDEHIYIVKTESFSSGSMFDPYIDEVKRLIDSTNEDMAELIKALAHSKRVLILGALLDGRKSFPELKKVTELSKTALANHIETMLSSYVIKRVDRGSYEITTDGRELINKIATVYHQSTKYQIMQRELLEKQYTTFRNFGDIMTKNTKKVSNVGIYQSHGLSYSAAISGVLQALGEEWDVDDVTAFSGYGFLINTNKEIICPSGPTALAAWKTIQESTELLGWDFSHYIDFEGFPSDLDPSKPLSETDEKRAKKFFNMVKEAIDKHDRPVVIWGIPVPEYGIVNGYQDDFYLVSTFRTLLKQEETPIAYNKLQAAGMMELFVFEKENKHPSEREYKKSIERALKMAKGEEVAFDGYAAGPEAYDVLIKQIMETEEEKIPKFAFGYLIDCYLCARDSAFNYLTKLSKKYGDKNFGKHIEKAAKTYEVIDNLYKELANHFPIFGDQDVSLENRERCANLLNGIKENELQAIKDLEEIIENWN